MCEILAAFMEMERTAQFIYSIDLYRFNEYARMEGLIR